MEIRTCTAANKRVLSVKQQAPLERTCDLVVEATEHVVQVLIIRRQRHCALRVLAELVRVRCNAIRKQCEESDGRAKTCQFALSALRARPSHSGRSLACNQGYQNHTRLNTTVHHLCALAHFSSAATAFAAKSAPVRMCCLKSSREMPGVSLAIS